MIIEFNDTILKKDPEDPIIRQSIEAAAIAAWRGHHFIFGSRSVLEFISLVSGLTIESKSVIEKCLKNYSTEASHLKSISQRVEICCVEQHPVKADGKWILPIEHLVDGISPTVLLTENLTDAALYKHAAAHYSLDQKSHLVFKVSCRGGGGSTTVDALKSIIEERREWVICVTDSDKSCPLSPLGAVANQCGEEVANSQWVARHEIIKGRTLENILPFRLVDEYLPGELRDGWDEFKRVTENGTKSTAIHGNLKQGVQLKWIRNLPAESNEREFWFAAARDSDVDLDTCVCANADCATDARCERQFVPALGVRIGEHVLANLNEASFHKGYQVAKSSPNFSHWLEIGAAVFNAGLAPRRTRA